MPKKKGFFVQTLKKKKKKKKEGLKKSFKISTQCLYHQKYKLETCADNKQNKI